MSKVLTQAKNRYQKAIIIESVCLVVLGLFLAIWQGESAVDFSLGFISAFVPFCAFAYIVFFRKQDFSTKLTAFYRGGLPYYALLHNQNFVLRLNKNARFAHCGGGGQYSF